MDNDFHRAFRLAIKQVEEKFSNRNNSLEFEVPDGISPNHTFLFVTWRIVVGSLDPREEFLIKCALILSSAFKAIEMDFEDDANLRLMAALKRFSRSYRSTYTGYSPMGIDAAKEALEIFKRNLSEINFDDVYADNVQFVLDIQARDPQSPFASWAVNQLNGASGQGWSDF